MRSIVIALVVFLLWIYSEVMLLLFVAQKTSIWVALLLTIGTGLVGIALARAQGWHLMRRIRQEFARGEVPVESLLSAAVLFFAGILLLIPGLITDVLGLLLLLPPVRRLFVREVKRWFQSKVRVNQPWRTPSHRGDYSSGGDVVDSYRVPADEERRLPDDRGSGI